MTPTPMLQQYLAIKEQYPGMLLFFRLGDFYELFFEDAVIASEILDIVLTSRRGLGSAKEVSDETTADAERIPMCGVPYHAAETYLSRLVAAGYRIAVCDQVEDPRTAKGIVRREVVRVVTPGTALFVTALPERCNSYVISLIAAPQEIVLGIIEPSTGYFACTSIDNEVHLASLRSELLRVEPAETLLVRNDEQLQRQDKVREILQQMGIPYSEVDSCDVAVARQRLFETGLPLVSGFTEAHLQAAAVVLSYLQDTVKLPLTHLKPLLLYNRDGTMLLDPATQRGLELVQTMRDGSYKGSLLWVIDKTHTVMGARMLRQWLLNPLVLKGPIEQRLDAVSELKDEYLLRHDLIALLSRVRDIERLLGRASLGTANARDLLALGSSLLVLPRITDLLQSSRAALLQQFVTRMPQLEKLCLNLLRSIQEEPPAGLREGGFIRDGYNAELDEYRVATRDGQQWVAALEQREKERSGIRNLKVGYNKVFGYYLEVTNPNLAAVPVDYIRKQTLVNCERFITPELKEIEERLLSASEKANELEYNLFCELLAQVVNQSADLQQAAGIIATLDCLTGFAQLAEENRYVRPELQEKPVLAISDGRHPVVEVSSAQPFIANDVHMDPQDKRILIITGPNMAGKSTYLRMTALIVLLAQIGCFVPAKEARISIFDRIFTRVGSGDDLSGGQSTFMVEMSELSAILANATSRSLLVLDEIGRGTSTFDGMSIARASLEYIQKHIGALTLFATHYHELTDMEDNWQGVTNLSVAVRERGEDVIFLHRIVPGAVDKSYGIAVARLAGLPRNLIERSGEILHDLERQKVVQERSSGRTRATQDQQQLALLPAAVKTELQLKLDSIDVMNMTPIEALNLLYELKKLV